MRSVSGLAGDKYFQFGTMFDRKLSFGRLNRSVTNRYEGYERTTKTR